MHDVELVHFERIMEQLPVAVQKLRSIGKHVIFIVGFFDRAQRLVFPGTFSLPDVCKLCFAEAEATLRDHMKPLLVAHMF